MEHMVKRVLTAFFVMWSFGASASCGDDDRAVGLEINKLYSHMHTHYMQNTLDFRFVDSVMMSMNSTFNTLYQQAFQIASRHNPTKCSEIRDHGLAWVAEQRKIVLNEISSRKR